MRKCKCAGCNLSKRVELTIKNGSREELVTLIQDLHEGYFMSQEDLSYEKAIADGSWPTSVEILKTRLEKAIKRNLPE